MKIISSWSGGKDSCYALMKALQEGHELACLLNVMNENGKISRSHGLTKDILEQQAKALNTELNTFDSTWSDYETKYIDQLSQLKQRHETKAVVFGDIDIESHKAWEEKVCAASDQKALLPIWQGNRKELVLEMIDSEIEAIITSCNNDLGPEFLGKKINHKTLTELENAGVDVCGENGEFHTVVVNCPLFSQRVILPESYKDSYNAYHFLCWR